MSSVRIFVAEFGFNDLIFIIKMKGTHFKDPARGGSVKRQIVNPDLEEERNNCTFN